MNRKTLFCAVLAILTAVVNLSAQRSAFVEGVDLQIPSAPVVVDIAGKSTLVYELHVTNFNAVDVSLVRVEVIRPDGVARSIADYGGEELRKRIGRPGLRRDQKNTEVIGPGLRAVVYLWLELPDSAAPPPAVRHRIEIDVHRATGGVHSIAEGGIGALSKTKAIALSPPLRGGPWIAIYDALLIGGHRTAIYTVNGRARIPGRFAIDFIRLPAAGILDNNATHGEDWNGYGSNVLAVADATVVAAMDDIAENADPPPPDAKPIPPENASGNYVALDLGDGRFAFYEHLKHGTIVVKTGDRVKASQVIGKLGYSGSSSMGPHLHFHVSDANSTLGAEGLPFVFTRFEQQGAFESIDALLRGSKPTTAAGGPVVRKMERPSANAVVVFP
jgi:murein DD-endopeptidase